MTKPTSFSGSGARAEARRQGGALGRDRRALKTESGRLAEVIPIRRATWKPGCIGVISNPKSHRNRDRSAFPEGATPEILFATPRTQTELAETLAEFAAHAVDLIVIDGGDGTVRDVITAARHAFAGALPRLAVIPSGKTNALALDLGIPLHWTIDAMLDAVQAGRFKTRAPIEIYRSASPVPDHVGFLLGAGAFVRATALAQRTHRVGAFNGAAVGLSLAWALAQTFFGAPHNIWRVGEKMRIEGKHSVDRNFYILFGSTLKRLPLGLKPFGHIRDGLKVLAIDAPPKRMPIAVPALLAGAEGQWLADLGYHRGDPDAFDLTLNGGFILDGERYPGGALSIRTGAPLQFATP